MKRFISSLLVASVLASSVPAWADEPRASPTVSPLQKGQPAPYTGVLLSPEAVAQVVAEKDTAKKEVELAVKHQSALDAAQKKFELDQLVSTCAADKKILQAQVDDNLRQIKILDDQLKKQSSGPSPTFWVGLGAVGGIVLTVATVFAVSQATK
jgi:hypothetical protein